eukprot:TRINITY_DN3277_c0_g1_i2.p5 TRINITY_DN3277_c0_g1~~TRINITY_DN3277_c0_g1_i2.p5  ORF type:complete len:269 (-),score=-9.85 TRINITY_DN3277_c0_g1_i2:2033-2839(-)
MRFYAKSHEVYFKIGTKERNQLIFFYRVFCVKQQSNNFNTLQNFFVRQKKYSYFLAQMSILMFFSNNFLFQNMFFLVIHSLTNIVLKNQNMYILRGNTNMHLYMYGYLCHLRLKQISTDCIIDQKRALFYRLKNQLLTQVLSLGQTIIIQFSYLFELAKLILSSNFYSGYRFNEHTNDLICFMAKNYCIAQLYNVTCPCFISHNERLVVEIICKYLSYYLVWKLREVGLKGNLGHLVTAVHSYIFVIVPKTGFSSCYIKVHMLLQRGL